MNASDNVEDEAASYVVLVNDEEQHCIWPAEKQAPQGWRVAYAQAPRAQCLEYIEQVWTDITPRSLRSMVTH